MDDFTWFAACAITILILFVMVVCIALLLDKRSKRNSARIYELRIDDAGNLRIHERKNRMH